MSYPGHLLGSGLSPLRRCSPYVLPPQPTGLTCYGFMQLIIILSKQSYLQLTILKANNSQSFNIKCSCEIWVIFKQIYLIHRWIRVNLGVIAMKGYTTISRAPELGPYNQMHFSVTLEAPFGARVPNPSAGDTISLF